jgi:hypothetical protein
LKNAGKYGISGHAGDPGCSMDVHSISEQTGSPIGSPLFSKIRVLT